LFQPEVARIAERADLLPVDEDIYAGSTPIAGILDPQRKTRSPDGEYFYFASTPIWRTAPGAVFRYQTNGGGGWGDPLTRDPVRVRADVRDEYVSIDGAYRDYGVVITGDPQYDPEGLRVDTEATEQRRAELRAQK
ncbi:MAG: hypothetical protein L0H83_07450, partial [Salinisphaera sp.]|nr:hypothetical protein [Salinisphaera sp.]